METYVPTAFAQLFFAWKLYDAALAGRIDREDVDREITFESEDKAQVFSLPSKIFDNQDDFSLAFKNHLTIAYGAAAITLDRTRHEAGYDIPDPINTEIDQCIALMYQIRCAFAHNIAKPQWKIKQRYKRAYQFGDISVDLTEKDGLIFDYSHIGGVDRLVAIKDFAEDQKLLGSKVR